MANNYNTNLISSKSYVQTPVINVKIGNYTFGMYQKDKHGYVQYPNYVQDLEITKINGQVNTYVLRLIYTVTEYNDPNYFEKVFSSVSKSRRIEFQYGDASNPKFLYRNEVAMITSVKSNFELQSSNIVYTVNAVSQSILGLTGSEEYSEMYEKPSTVITNLLKNPNNGLTDLFTGMKNLTLVGQYNLIPGNDVAVKIEKKSNISVLSYLEYLVSLMSPDIKNRELASHCIYVLTYVDDTSGLLNGSYFKIVEVDTDIEHPEAYQLDIGYPGNNYVFNFNVDNDENYSIYYEYQNKLHPQEYVSRLNADGDYEEVYAPSISSGNTRHSTPEESKAWWAKVTKYPIKASVTIKGLLRPAILMTYVRLNIILFGKKHINSGLYIITKQVDKVDGSGYQTTLNMTKISGDSGTTLLK